MTDYSDSSPKAAEPSPRDRATGIWHAFLSFMCRDCRVGAATLGVSRDWHTILALSMVVVATIGALVAGCTAVAEQEAHRLSRLLAWGQHLALTQRQEWLSEAALYETLDLRSHDYYEHGKSLLATAQGAGNMSPESRAWIRLQAQEEFAAARALEPYFSVLWTFPAQDQKLKNVEQRLQKRLAFFLAAKGFDTVWSTPPAAPGETGVNPPASASAGMEASSIPESAQIWTNLLDKLERSHRMVPLLAGGVVLLVLPLFLFTIASTRCGPVWKRRLLYVGWAVAAAGLLFVGAVVIVYRALFADLYEIIKMQPFWAMVAFFSAPILLLFLFAASAAELASVWRSSRADSGHGALASESVEPTRPASLNMPVVEPATGLSRCIVSLIAISALCTALCGLGYSLAASRAAEAAHQALEQGVEMNTRNSWVNAVTNTMLLTLFNTQEYRVKTIAALQGAYHLKVYWEDSKDQAKAFASVYSDYEQKITNSPIKDPQITMDTDKYYPVKLKYGWMKPDYLMEQPLAQWDAYSQRSLTWHAKARIFLGILTILAMAIYLFGQAHGMGEGPWAERLILYGCLLLLIAVFCGLITIVPGSFETRKGQAREDEAATLYAVASQKLNSARYDPRDYREAVPYLEKVTELRPNFAMAQMALINALENASSSQAGESFMSLVPKDELPNIIKHRQKALEVLKANGFAEPAKSLNALGYHELLLGLTSRDLSLVQESIRHLKRQGADGGDMTEQALIRWNLRLAQMAAGEKRTIDDETVRLLAETGNKQLISSLFTDLEVLARYYCGLHGESDCQQTINDAVERAKERYVEVAWPAPSTHGPAAGKNLATVAASIDLTPYSLRWSGRLPGFSIGRDQLVLVWYAYDPQWEVWRALPEVSGPVDLVDNKKEVKVSPDGVMEINLPYSAKTNWTRCLPAGKYRAELYINGQLTADPPEAFNSAGNFTPKRLFDLNLALCCPENWRPLGLLNRLKDIPDRLRADSWLVRGFETGQAGGKPAVFVFTFYPAVAGGEAGGAAQDPETEAVQRAKSLLAEMKWITGNEVCTPYDPTRGCDTAEPPGGMLQRNYWVTGEGVQHVGIALMGAAPLNEVWHTLHSMTNLYEPVTVPTSGK